MKSDRRTLTTRESDRPHINTLSTAPTENLFSGKVLRIQLFNYLQSISRRKQFFSTPERKKSSPTQHFYVYSFRPEMRLNSGRVGHNARAKKEYTII